MESLRCSSVRRPVAALAVALVLVVAACSDDPDQSVAAEDQVAAAASSGTTVDGQAEPDSSGEGTPQPFPYVSYAELKRGELDGDLDAGIYSLATMGLPSATVTLDDGWTLELIGPGSLEIAGQGGDPWRNSLKVVRPNQLYVPGKMFPPAAVADPTTDLLSLDDIGGWLASAAPTWGVSDAVPLDIGGHAAFSFRVTPDIEWCAPDDPPNCPPAAFAYFATGTEDELSTAVEAWHRATTEVVWVQDVDGRPLVLLANLGPNESVDDEWLANARSVIDSLTLG